MRPNTLQSILDKLEPIPESGCLVYSGTWRKDGYAQIFINGSTAILLHRYIYENLVGPIPEGYEIDHLCKVRPCANPYHLEAVTPRVNTLRSNSIQAQFARRTHCAKGHPLIPLRNDKRCSSPMRMCPICRKEYQHEKYERYKAQFGAFWKKQP